jgi:hypothetical protein
MSVNPTAKVKDGEYQGKFLAKVWEQHELSQVRLQSPRFVLFLRNLPWLNIEL